MKFDDLHTERLNFTLSEHLKNSIKIAAHAQLMSVSDYIRGLIYKDLMKNSELSDKGVFYTVKHKLNDVTYIDKDGTFKSSSDIEG